MEINVDSINKASINLSRNTPVALVVGAAGFLGSSLVDKLLDHRIQIVGVDDFSTGLKENLENATKDSHFHLINQDASQLSLDVVRLDYIFIVADEGWRIDNILYLAKKYDSKIVFISWIDLYSNKTHLPWFKNAEGKLADFAKDNKLNARVVRLAAIFGPRMNFKVDDPIISLIRSSITGKIQEEGINLEFSSRALFIEDATNLVVKSMLQGGTAWKIFDGALLSPIKVTEIKQVLLDPLWHENKGFTPTELPPWPTPNLEKTRKELHWQPKVNLVEALKKTLAFFKNHEFKPTEKPEFKRVEERILDREEEKKVEEKPQEEKKKKDFRFPWRGLIALLVIFYGLVYPLMALSLGMAFLNFQEKSAFDNLKKGNYQESLNDLSSARGALDQIKSAVSPFLLVGEYIVADQVRKGRKELALKDQYLIGTRHFVNGVKELSLGFRIVTGQSAGDSADKFETAKVELQAAEGLITPASLELTDEDVKTLAVSVSKTRQLAEFLPKLFGDKEKNYLFVVADNNEIRPGGGLISSLALISFEGGKLKKVEVLNLAAISDAAKAQPPKEIKEDLGESSWTIKDANWEADFPASAKQIETFFKLAGKGELDGVITTDISALADLISRAGELNLSNGTKISSDNLFTIMASQGSKSGLLDLLTEELLNKVFFQYSPATTASSIQKSLSQKHITLYFNKGDLQSTVLANNWGGSLGSNNVISVVDSNFGGNKANFFLDRSFILDLSEGSSLAKLQINYTNRSQNDIWPGGTYKNRVRIFLPFGSKINSVKWGMDDLTEKAETFSDYNLTVTSLLLTLDPIQTKSLSIDFKLPEVKELNFIKQPGTNSDPITIKLLGGKVINTTLSTDQKFEAI